MTATSQVTSASVVLLLFGVYCQVSTFKASATVIRTEIESDLVCQISEWQTIRLKSHRIFEGSNKSPVLLLNFSSFWTHHGKEFKNTTEKQLFLAGKYTPNCTTTSCPCNGDVSVSILPNTSVIWRSRLSFLVEIPSVGGAKLLGVRFVAFKENNLEVYLRPSTNNIADVSFVLKHCQVGFPFDDSEKYKYCPTWSAVSFECSEHLQDIYGVPNSKGFICGASIQAVFGYAKYKFHIVTSGANFTSISEVFNISTKQSRNSSPLPNKPGNFQLLLISPKPRYIITKPMPSRRIKTVLENNKVKLHIMSYNCSNGVNGSNRTKMRNHFVIDNVGFRPAIECRVCVQALKFSGGAPSEPVCNTTRLFEEKPEGALNITCNSDTCPSTSEGESRNVTVMCEFPPKSKWNGDLTMLVTKYRNDNSSEYKTVSQSVNRSSCHSFLTGLSTKRTYFIRMQYCNSKGCSSTSNEVIIAPLNHRDTSNGNSFTLWWLVAVILVSVVLLAAAIFAVVYRRVNKADRNTLPDIPPLPDYDALADNDDENRRPYDKLPESGDEITKSDADDNSNAVYKMTALDRV